MGCSYVWLSLGDCNSYFTCVDAGFILSFHFHTVQSAKIELLLAHGHIQYAQTKRNDKWVESQIIGRDVTKTLSTFIFCFLCSSTYF